MAFLTGTLLHYCSKTWDLSCPVHHAHSPVHLYVFADSYLLSDRLPPISSNFSLWARLLDMIIFPHLSYLRLVHIFLGEHFSKYKRVFTNSLNNQTITSCISQAKPIHTFQMFAFFKHHHCFGKTVGYWLVVSLWEVTMVRSLFSAFLVAPRYGFEHSTGPAWIWWFALDLVELHPTFQAIFLILQCHFAFYSLIFTCSASQFWDVCRFHTYVFSSVLRSKNENV